MNITIDKNYTICSALKPLKGYAKEFKVRYTERDLMSVADTYGEILKCDVEMWCNSMPICGECSDDDVGVRVVLWLDDWDTVKKVEYYCNGALTLSPHIAPEILTYERTRS